MARVLVNALASNAGGGITYLHNFFSQLNNKLSPHHYFLLLPADLLAQFSSYQNSLITVIPVQWKYGLLGRSLFEQWSVRKIIKEYWIDCLVSLGNIAMFYSPACQILFHRNALYCSDYFVKDLQRRRDWALLLDHKIKSLLARLSAKQATMHASPSFTFANELKTSYRLHADVQVISFGIDSDKFAPDTMSVGGQFAAAETHSSRKNRAILLASHYNYFRNFETVLCALPKINDEVKKRSGQTVKLILTTKLVKGRKAGGYDMTKAADLIATLKLTDQVVMFDQPNYTMMQKIYAQADLVVCASYAESFGHPMLEAMASNKPLIAADLPIQREICGDAARYFSVFDSQDLADKCVDVLLSPEQQVELITAGRKNCERYSWETHFIKLSRLIDKCLLISTERREK